MYEEIAGKWSTIQKYNDPLNIHDDIAAQKEKCDVLIKQKDDIIAMLKNEVKEAEKKYTRDQRKQVEDINILTQRIEKQVLFMRKAYQKEYELIEEVIAAERQNLIDMNNKKWDELFKKREQQEVFNSDAKFDQLEEFTKKMMQLRIDFQEKFRETKIQLENDIEHLQQELERIKSLALLNSEKLDYNYQILKKREDENLIINSQQKRRLNKLQDLINDLRKKISEYESSTNNRIKKLTEDIKKLHRNILEVEAKADRFAQTNDEKFHKIWEINRKVCVEVLNKILATDRVLHEQQMGIMWESPKHNLVRKEALQSYKDALLDLEENASKTGSQEMGLAKSTSSIKHAKPEIYSEEKLDSQVLDQNPIYRRLLKYILVQVSDKSGFLTEKRLKMLLTHYEDDQRTLVRLDNVFASLGVQNVGDIDLLVNFFIPYAHCPKCCGSDETSDSGLSRYTSQISHISAILSHRNTDPNTTDIYELDEAFAAVQIPDNLIEEVVVDLVTSEVVLEDLDLTKETNEGFLDDFCSANIQGDFRVSSKERKSVKKIKTTSEKTNCRFNHPLVISSVYVLNALRDFVSVYYKQSKGLPTTRDRLEKKRATISRMLSDNDIISYWERYRNVYGEERVRVWDGLLEGLKYYHQILKDRKSLSEEVVDLRRQNDDLKRLLASYIDHGEYMNPPCAVHNEQCLETKIPAFTKNK